MILNVTQKEMREMSLKWISDEGGIVELGCSNGDFAELLFKNNMKNYCGIDIQKDKIQEAKIRLPQMGFFCCDIINNLFLLEEAQTFISFQCLEHIVNDLDVLKALIPKTNVILSVPNSPYKGHIRWHELEGWEERFSPYIDFDYSYIIQNPIKPNKRSFLFKGVRNDNDN